MAYSKHYILIMTVYNKPNIKYDFWNYFRTSCIAVLADHLSDFMHLLFLERSKIIGHENELSH